MADHSSAQIPPPRNWQDFERDSRILFECILKDRGVQKNGRSGQAQNGVDIYGRQNGEGDKWIGVQCKGKDANYGQVVTEAELRDEVNKTRGFEPELSEFYLITTAPDDAVIQKAARTITNERTKEGRPLSVNVWGWGQIQEQISRFPEAINAFSPDSSPFTGQLMDGNRKISEQNEANANLLQDIKQLLTQKEFHIHTDIENSAKERFDKELHIQIDQYRDLLVSGKPKTALNFLESLKDRCWATASDRVKFRVTTNIALSKLELAKDNAEESANLLIEASEFQPEDPKSKANIILANILLGNREKAIELATEFLAKDNNEYVALYLLQSSAMNMDIDDPLELIPDAIKEAESVYNGLIIFHRLRNNSKWIDISREAVAKYPKCKHLIRFNAEAEIQDYLSGKPFFKGEKNNSNVNIKKLQEASDKLQGFWDDQLNSELPNVDPSLPYNLALSYKILLDDEKESKVISKAIELFPDNSDIVRFYANDLIRKNNRKEAIKVLNNVFNDIGSLLMLAEVKSSEDPQGALEILEKTKRISTISSYERMVATGLTVDCILKNKTESEEERIKLAEEEIGRVIEKYKKEPLIWVIKANIYKFSNDTNRLEDALERAANLVTDKSNFYERLTLSQVLESFGKYSASADILNGYVDASYDSPALRTLFFSLLKSDRRGAANELLRNMPDKVSQLPIFLEGAYWLHIRRGDYKSAESVISKLIYEMPNELNPYLLRIDVWLRLRNEKDIASFLKGDAESLSGKPLEKMRLANILIRFGYHERAFSLSYRITVENSSNHNIVLSYIELFLSPWLTSCATVNMDKVSENTYFKIRDENGEIEEFIVENNDEIVKVNNISILPGHMFSRLATGLGVGDGFEDNIGGCWTIIEVKHKYLYLLHFLMHSFNRKFPHIDGFRRFVFNSDAAEKSIMPILDSVKESYDHNEKIIKLYEKGLLPLGAIANWMKIDVIQLWQELVSKKIEFKVCVGGIGELDMAFRNINENMSRGCVLDALTLHIVNVMGLYEIVSNICGKLYTTESVVNVFRERYHEIANHNGQPFVRIFWQDGTYYRDEVSPQDIESIRRARESELNWVESNIKTIPSETQHSIPIEAEKIRDSISSEFLDPVLLANNNEYILLCEDQAYRQLSNRYFDIKSSWLQPVLKAAVDRGVISINEYMDAISFMIDSGHGFISIESNLLLFAKERGINKLESIAKALFCINAEVTSHQKVLIQFLKRLWGSKLEPTLEQQAATSILLRRLFFGKWRASSKADTTDIVLSILSPMDNNRIFLKYLNGWMDGHFIAN